jgi:hypothetical protein
MKRASRTVDRLLAQLPGDDPERHDLQAQAAKYGRACGCSLGAAFLAVSALLVVIYFAAGGELDLRNGLVSVVFVFIASLVGKVVGLLFATLRLRLLGRSIARRVNRRQRGLGHVHVH